MHYKPLPILILSFLHIVSPIYTTIYYSMFHQVTPWEYLRVVYTNGNFLEFMYYLFLMPIAGVLIFLVKKWSFYALLIVQLFSLYLALKYATINWNANIKVILNLFIFNAINMGVTLYFLRKSINLLYRNPKVRWWEQSIRYTINQETDLKKTKTLEQDVGEIKNLSITGVLLSTTLALHEDDYITTSFVVLDYTFELQGKVAWCEPNISQRPLYGIKFTELNLRDNCKLYFLTKKMEKLKYERNPPKRKYFLELKFALSEVISKVKRNIK
ncbi:PilZ domain-containing protein [Bacteriovoracaceae bacterium]|nr:PilZ domain-containing protein [Bacteriovoracaceae bacterium]